MGNKTQCYVVRAGESKNELCHWKYIKREKRPNGKWRYYYDVKELKNDVKDKLGYDEREEIKQTWQKLDHERETVKKMTDNFNAVPRNDGSTYGNKTKAEWYDEMIKAEKNMKEAGKNHWDAMHRYYKTPLGQLHLLKDEMTDAKNWLKKKLGIK